MERKEMRCLFYEATGKTTCPFHIIRYDLYYGDMNGFIKKDHYATKRPKPKKRKKSREKARRKS